MKIVIEDTWNRVGGYYDWDDWHVRRYVFAQNRRAAFAWLELNELRAEKGLPPVPLTGFVANVDEPRKQIRWDE